MADKTYLQSYLDGAPELLLFAIQLTVLCLPMLVAVGALLRLRDPRPPRSAYFCLGAGVLLFLTWLIPPSWLGQTQMRQLRDFAALGFYGWVMFDWSRMVAEDGWRRMDLMQMAVILLLIGMTLAGFVLSR